MKNIQRKAAKEFAAYWKDKGYEKGESQKFWLSLLRDVFGMEKPEQHIEFEEKVKLEHTNFIDAYIPEAKILIEQKGRDVNLWKANKQSDGSVLTPYQQAKRYIIELPVSKHPRWVITCNFKEFHIYNMEKPGGDPIVVKLENLEKEYYLLQILAYKENIVLKKEMDLSIAAGDIVGLLYNALAKQYKNPENAHSMKSLNVLCVRFVFCLYAEDAGVFKRHGQFHDYLMNFSAIDWNNIIDKTRLSYILGNPPFVGRRYRSPEQTKDVAKFFTYKDIDYVACWYKKAADYIQNTHIKCALVSTNSITQGEQVTALWKELMQNYNICIDFAHKTFRWDSEASLKAHVHCVIVGFSVKDSLVKEQKKLYDGINYFLVDNINGYLMDGPNIFLENHSSPICDVPKMKNGNVPLDGDALKIEKEDLPKFKNCMQYVKRLIGGRELLHGEERYVLWLVGASPAEIKKYPQIYKRVEQCRQNRLNMKDKGTQKLADTPATFRDTNNPDKYIALPMVSSERRRYIPMDYLDGNVIPTNQVQTIPEASLYHFGVLNSNVHMCWMRAVCGRLKSDFRYSKDIVYNNFPWPTPTPEQKRKIEETAQGILNARATYPDSCLSDLYDDNIMPADLRIAHNYNNIAVLEAYGFTKSSPAFRSESACVAELMKMYQKIVSK